MMDQVKINGIRLNKNFVQVTQAYIGGQDQSCVPLYQALASNGVNMVSMTLGAIDNSKSFVSGTIASQDLKKVSCQDESWDYHRDVCSIAIYPHHYRLQPLGFFLYLLGSQKISFQNLISSNAMLTFIIDQTDCDAVIDIISENFDLPPSHVPFEQEENVEQTEFLKRRYPETRATYMEKKIKTYGITLVPDLSLCSYLFSFDQLAEYGQKIQPMQDKEDKFFYISAYMATPAQTHLFLLTGKSISIPARQTCSAELLSFHGPHFGDRHSIISRALNCLSQRAIPVLQTGCTGASIGIVLPEGFGKEAKNALKDVFEIPY
ncbi:MAG: hypothetical protein K8S13_24085 [Desulfobacula sp.]|uniref:hypothetical protein n=1 Tax=Desulfobacula sp. TaxID=2593537 RepID=UPI0025B8ABC8|nr:hypothetical protein [Desulfobacula sp.]MCD4722909.1 hypothetical protein [Desulfobacula sp.]